MERSANFLIKIILKRSCNSEGWSNNAENSGLALQEHFLKFRNVEYEKKYF